VIWASAGLLGIAIGLTSAALQRQWTEVRRAALPLCIVILGAIIGHFVPDAHTWSMWAAVLAGTWAAFRNTGLSSFATFLGTLGLAAAGILARSLF